MILLRLVDHLPLFLGVAVLAGLPVVRQHVAGQLGGVGRRPAAPARRGRAAATCASSSISPLAPLPDDAW